MINKKNIVWILAGVVLLGIGYMAYSKKGLFAPKVKIEPKPNLTEPSDKKEEKKTTTNLAGGKTISEAKATFVPKQ